MRECAQLMHYMIKWMAIPVKATAGGAKVIFTLSIKFVQSAPDN